MPPAERRRAGAEGAGEGAVSLSHMSDVQDWNAKIIEEFRANQGQLDGQFAGSPVLLLGTTGAKTGRPRTNPVMYLDLEGHRYVFASKAGADVNPDWYHNLRANPQVTVEVGAHSYRATATTVAGADRDRIYEEQVRRYPQFGEYASKTSRVIPVVDLQPGG